MRCEWTDLPELGQTGLRGVPDDYDALRFPDVLLVDRWPRAKDPDRVAVCCALLFGRRVEGRLALPEPVSPLVALEIERYLAPAHVRVPAVDFEPRKLPVGGGMVLVADDDEHVVLPPTPIHEPRRSVLRLTRSDRTAGPSTGPAELALPSNAWLFSDWDHDPVTRTAALLAVAVLVAEDLEASSLSVSVPPLDREAVLRTFSPLLAATGLGLDARERQQLALSPG